MQDATVTSHLSGESPASDQSPWSIAFVPPDAKNLPGEIARRMERQRTLIGRAGEKMLLSGIQALAPSPEAPSGLADDATHDHSLPRSR
jgi:hypothetical protein